MQLRKNDTAWSQERKYGETSPGPEHGKARLLVCVCETEGDREGKARPMLAFSIKKCQRVQMSLIKI